MREPSFLPYPYAALRRVTRREAAIESAIARWVAARPLGARIERLAGAPVRARIGAAAVDAAAVHRDPHAALAEVRVGGMSIVLAGASLAVRRLAQRLLGGPEELAAPRPLTATEQAIWALAIATAIEDTGVVAEVWPLAARPAGPDAIAIELVLESAAGDGPDARPLPSPMTVVAWCPPGLVVQAPPPRPVPAWPIDLAVIVARSAIPRAAVRALAPRDVITVEGCLELAIGDGAVALSAAPGAIEARVATEYVRRDMALPDDAHLELTVQLGTTRLALRRIAELAVGQIVPLGRPLAGPYEIRAAGGLIGHGELIDVDGELGVRIVSLISPEE